MKKLVSLIAAIKRKRKGRWQWYLFVIILVCAIKWNVSPAANK
jgi:hypothetical protein